MTVVNSRDIRLLIVDDEVVALRNLAHVFRKEGYQVTTRQSGGTALKELRNQSFDVVLTDLRMDRVDGMQVMREAKHLHPDCEVILITGHGSLNSAVAAMKEGAFHYVAKPFRLDEVRQIVRSALEIVVLKQENRELRRRIEGYQGQVNIITRDLQTQRLLDMAREVAPSDCNVLISGESGTGKELFARYVHVHSTRVSAPFVAVNCGVFQEELLANELFGHERGAFTGADRQKLGLVEVAQGGTLFLDEIAEMAPGMQVKLLRLLQEREFMRVGGTRPVKADVRFIAATNRDLQEAIAAGRFRQDLYFRLNVVHLHLTPLRERRGDVPLLAYYILKKAALAMNKLVEDIDAEAMVLLSDYDFPGNVRELVNIIERGVALCRGRILEQEHLPEMLKEARIKVYPVQASRLPSLETQESDYIRRVLEHTQGNRSKAAEILGIDRVSLWRKLKRYGLN